MTAIFLTPEQLEELTGYVQPFAQRRWLSRSGLTFYVRADGKPVVPIAAVERREIAPRPAVPNFAALRKAG